MIGRNVFDEIVQGFNALKAERDGKQRVSATVIKSKSTDNRRRRRLR